MKKLSIVFALFYLFAISACEDTDDKDILHVIFENDEVSQYTIVGLELIDGGYSADPAVYSGEWSDNILPAGTQLAPGDQIEFDLEVKNGYQKLGRITVLDGQGTEVDLFDENGTFGYEIPFVYWGGDSRHVHVTVSYDTYYDRIWITGAGGWAL